MDLRNTLILVALMLAAVASGFLLFRASPGNGDRTGEPRLGIGYYIDNAKLTGTGEDGRALYRVTARTASQSLEDGAVDLQDIEMTYGPANDIPWDLSANAGRIPPDAAIIQLSGDVVAVSREANAAPVIIRTDYLEIDPETYIARTERRVTVQHNGNTLLGTGLRAYFKEDRLQLMSDVNGKFVP